MRAWRRADRLEAARETERRHESRHLETWVDEDGMVVIRGRLTPELGAVVQRALEAAGDRLFREARAADEDAPEVTPPQRRADALGIVAESALANDLHRGTAGDRYQVVIHVDDERLKERSEAQAAPDSGQAVLEESGTRISAETSRRFACDASTVVMHHASDGTVLDVGRKRRTIPPAIRRALTARDRSCQFPGCAARHCEVHHLRHWADGGTTRLDNLTLVCKRHHRAIHEEGFTLRRKTDGTVHAYRPDGRQLPSVPIVARWTARGDRPADALAPTCARLTAAGIFIGPRTGMPAWYGECLDLGWALTVLRDQIVGKTSRAG